MISQKMKTLHEEIVAFNEEVDTDTITLKRQKTKYHSDVPDHLVAVSDLTRASVDFLLTSADEMKYLVKSAGGDER